MVNSINCYKYSISLSMPRKIHSYLLSNMKRTTVSQRARIHLLRKQGNTIHQIAIQESLSPSTVAYICKHISPSCEDKPRSGRPSTVSKPLQRKISRLITSGKCQTAVDVKSSLQINDHVDISVDTIRRILTRSGLVARIKRKKPFLSEKHRQQRRAFALKYKDWTIEDWNKVVWSDESKFD